MKFPRWQPGLMVRERAARVSVAGRGEMRLRLFRTDLYGPFQSQGELWAQGWSGGSVDVLPGSQGALRI